ncbi:DUF4307 domain-containing protein [Micromonospora sp. WMMA1998]|uniref:DUF4307 domain-containing protein n=1 Tax=Micromonospora sediminicola TaxID=946078 RepID=A0A1A9BGQ5_9ACTN|nr:MULTISPECIES: DUF4307 domain-containing protein [Micromonospora]ATO14947.1 DUF4307 domain-containing protein [Micromonospora sp. WMMA2032]PGH43400.1 DUF4307 domain-containing protein [Micromonospora sp. WMMA1996]WBC14065.1 DUF4307 domain-containing protein [Micromonospora sp. WMMA1998]SBT68695.1 protein of unknown function (DUF4307) [Micromonospora sediminicola]
MSETHATVTPGTPVFPPGRYGRRREPGRRRPLLLALTVTVLLAVLGLAAAKLYSQYGDPEYQGEMISYTGITDSRVVVDFRVTVPPGGSATCLLRARSHDGAEVGHVEATVTAESGQRHVRARQEVPTSARPFIGEVLRCRPTG